MEIQVQATKTVSDVFDKEVLDGYCKKSVDMIADGRPRLDGKKDIAALHFYDTDHGKIGTLVTWVRGIPAVMYLGTEQEVIDIKDDFYKLVEGAGLRFQKNPRQRAEQRKQMRKKAKKYAKSK